LSPVIATLTNVQTTLLTMHSTFSGLIAQIDAFSDGATAMGKAFDGAKNDDFFIYLRKFSKIRNSRLA
jgi:RND superfamily putative drug exporter